MSSVDPTDPSSTPSTSNTTPTSQSSSGGGWNPPPLTWLGITYTGPEAKELWNILIQNISNQIQNDQAKQIEAIKKMNPDNDDDQ